MLLLNGDCIELMKGLPDKSVDMVLCDLPYGTTQCKWDTPISLPDFWEQIGRVTKPNACTALFAQTPFDKVLGCSNLKELRYEWIWEKNQATGHLNAKKMPMKAHENILIFYKSLPTYNPQITHGHKHKVSSARHKEKCKKSECYGDFVATSYDSTDRYPRDVLHGASDKQKLSLHPTQKPVWLCEELIKTYTNEGETVLDCCMGSGTTGAACASTGRDFIGFELDPVYFELAQNRIELITEFFGR
jgi:site-specific DNA-methyltransferase (adenine-specific)